MLFKLASIIEFGVIPPTCPFRRDGSHICYERYDQWPVHNKFFFFGFWSSVYRVAHHLHTNEIAHNLFMTRGAPLSAIPGEEQQGKPRTETVRVILWPRKSTFGRFWDWGHTVTFWTPVCHDLCMACSIQCNQHRCHNSCDLQLMMPATSGSLREGKIQDVIREKVDVQGPRNNTGMYALPCAKITQQYNCVYIVIYNHCIVH